VGVCVCIVCTCFFGGGVVVVVVVDLVVRSCC